MLALTKRIDYGLIALAHLAVHREQVAAREIAARYRMPQALLMNVLKSLAQHGLVRSSRGSRGGYELAREPESITLNDVIEAIEGPVRLVKCAGLEGLGPTQRCELLKVCPVSGPVRRLHRRLKDFLCDVTLAEIAFDPEFDRQADLPAAGEASMPREMMTVGLALTANGRGR